MAPFRCAPLLAAQVEIALATADLETARCAAEQLSEVAGTFHSRALLAAASLARGRVALAAGDAVLAVQECEDALTGWSDVARPSKRRRRG
jgi:hypothetical protein